MIKIPNKMVHRRIRSDSRYALGQQLRTYEIL